MPWIKKNTPPTHQCAKPGLRFWVKPGWEWQCEWCGWIWLVRMKTEKLGCKKSEITYKEWYLKDSRSEQQRIKDNINKLGTRWHDFDDPIQD